MYVFMINDKYNQTLIKSIILDEHFSELQVFHWFNYYCSTLLTEKVLENILEQKVKGKISQVSWIHYVVQGSVFKNP